MSCRAVRPICASLFVRGFSASHTHIYFRSFILRKRQAPRHRRSFSLEDRRRSCAKPRSHLLRPHHLLHRTAGAAAFFPTMGLCASSKPAVPSGMKLHVLPPSANSHGCIAVVKDLGMDIEVRDAAEFAGGISHGPYLFREL